MADPMDIMAIDDVGITTGMEVIPVLSKLSDIQMIIDKYIGKEKALAVAEAFKQEQAVYDNSNAQEDDRREDVENSPIVQLVRNVIEQAARQRASDIHIEPFEYNIRVRYRIDGSLNEAMVYDKALYAAMIARIKIISGMDIAEKRKPQDGRITMDIDHKEYVNIIIVEDPVEANIDGINQVVVTN